LSGGQLPDPLSRCFSLSDQASMVGLKTSP
jgi:hypothetical protein